MKHQFLCVCLIFCLHLSGQTQTENVLKSISPDDYSLWINLLNNPGVSPGGTWISFTINSTEADSIIIEKNNREKRFVIPNATGARFLGDSLLSYCQDENNYLLFLNTGRREKFSPGTVFILCENDKFLIIYNKPSMRLIIRSNDNNTQFELNSIYDIYYNPVYGGIAILYNENDINKIGIINLSQEFQNEIKELSLPTCRRILEFKWHTGGNFFGFSLGKDESSEKTNDVGLVGYYDLKRDKLYLLNPADIKGFPEGHIIISHWNYPLEFSPDGNCLFFTHQSKHPLGYNELPIIWKSNDPYIGESMLTWSSNIPKISVWEPAKNRHSFITDLETPEAFYGINEEYALVFNPASHKLQADSTINDIFDVYLLNFARGYKELIIRQFRNNPRCLNISPSGKYVLYFNDDKWWCYNTFNKTFINITDRIRKVSEVKYISSSDHAEGWSHDEKTVFVYDNFDLWAITIDDDSIKRITFGRENETYYKLINNTPLKSPSDLRNNRGVIINDSVMFFQFKRGDKTGFSFKRKDDCIVSFFMDECNTIKPRISFNNQVMSFVKETYSSPPSVMVYDVETDSLRTVFQSNKHFKNFHWYRQEKISYRDSNGEELLGILKYPTEYIEDSIYPMIVHVYEKQSTHWNYYTNPSFYNGTGFNSTNLVADGYFVFLPDIVYETAKPGFSAVNCIVSGVMEVLKNKSINSEKIGLIGHSFGGYETMFTITQTDLFATAIAGAGISYFPADYFNISGKTHRFFQYEDSQLRMKETLFNNYQGYLNNSPLYHAKNVNIPFMLYTGAEDFHVNYSQSMIFHSAMKRLGKKSTLLIYPGEGHVFLNPETQKDLTLKIHQWFGHYLKGKEKQKWMP